MSGSENLLVLASNHGTGSTTFIKALEAHPCIVGAGDWGEPFDGRQMRFYHPQGHSSIIKHGSDGKLAEPGEMYQVANGKIVRGSFACWPRACDEGNATWATGSALLKGDASAGLPQYLHSVRAHLCHEFPPPHAECGGRCVLATRSEPKQIEPNDQPTARQKA